MIIRTKNKLKNLNLRILIKFLEKNALYINIYYHEWLEQQWKDKYRDPKMMNSKNIIILFHYLGLFHHSTLEKVNVRMIVFKNLINGFLRLDNLQHNYNYL